MDFEELIFINIILSLSIIWGVTKNE